VFGDPHYARQEKVKNQRRKKAEEERQIRSYRHRVNSHNNLLIDSVNPVKFDDQRPADYLNEEQLDFFRQRLGDPGVLRNDAGFAFGLTQFLHLEEHVLRLNAVTLQARYPMDGIVPGGVAHDLSDDSQRELVDQLAELEAQVTTLRGIYDEHAGMQDRFVGAGQVAPALAALLGLTGLAGRASGQGRDLRCDLPCVPYDRLRLKKVVRNEGSVAARVAVRFDELLEIAAPVPRGTAGAARGYCPVRICRMRRKVPSGSG
jgi:hypothetical protein